MHIVISNISSSSSRRWCGGHWFMSHITVTHWISTQFYHFSTERSQLLAHSAKKTRQPSMQDIATDVVTQRGLCVCLCVGHTGKLCKNGRTGWDVECGWGTADSSKPKEPCIRSGVYWRHLVNTTECAAEMRAFGKLYFDHLLTYRDNNILSTPRQQILV